MLGTAQVLIKQVIMYHECTCNHADMTVEVSTEPISSETSKVVLHTETDRDIEKTLINSHESAWSRSLAKAKKEKSKSNVSLASILEINVIRGTLVFHVVRNAYLHNFQSRFNGTLCRCSAH